MENKVMAAMSGGVDSSVAALLLKNAGYVCAGATMQLYRQDDTDETMIRDVRDARDIAQRLGINHYVFDFSEEFKKEVIGYFIDEYKSCRTPNPCVVCNRKMKFGRFFEESQKLGFDMMATGHYARIENQGSRHVLCKAKDRTKDQSYFLYSLTPAQLEHILFPLGELTKPEIRELAAESGFENAKKGDSQDVCFIPNGDYADFICRYTGELFPDGNFTDRDGRVLGRHHGIIRYTVGQRKGLGLSLPAPMYVYEKNAQENTVILAENAALFSPSLEAEDFVWSACDIPDDKLRASAKIRHSQTEALCTVYPTSIDSVHIEFDSPQRAISKGQAVVIYSGDTLIGGGTII